MVNGIFLTQGRVGIVDTGIFIHAIVPRHVETVAKMTRGG